MKSPMQPSAASRSRRRFLSRLGLGAGAGLLGPIVEGLVSEAQGQTSKRKRVVFFITGNGIKNENFLPTEVRSNSADTLLPGRTDYTWPTMFKALEPYRSRMLLVDGLANQCGSPYGHTGGFGALSNVEPQGGAEKGGPPGAQTIDQFLAGKLGGDTRLKSVLYGITQTPKGPTMSSVFGAGSGKPQSHILSPKLLYSTIFDGLGSTAAADPKTLRKAILLDSIRHEVKRVQGNLAGEERRKLDDYLAAIDDMEKRQTAQGASLASCQAAKAPAVAGDDWNYGADRPAEALLESMTEMAAVALACGITNVAGVSFGTGHSHYFFPRFYRLAQLVPTSDWDGKPNYIDGALHNEPSQTVQMNVIHNFNAGLIARMIAVLSKIKEGNGTAWDNTVFVYFSENGDAHHAERRHWPVAIIGSGGGGFKADGSFLRYPRKPAKGYRSMGDLFCTLATGLGFPTDSFGKGGVEPVVGPLTELLA